MFWFLRLPENAPSEVYKILTKLDEDEGLESLDPEQRLRIVEQMRAWELSQGKNLYLPNHKEQRFSLESRFIKAISGGNRSGKTATCVIDVVSQCEGWHPLQRENLKKLAEDSVFEWVRDLAKELLQRKAWIKSPPVKARCTTVDFPNFVERIVGPEYEKWATREDIRDLNYDHQNKRRIRWKNGSFVEFMTYEQPLKAHGGAARDVMHYDEEPPAEIWQEGMLRTASTKGRMVLGMTAVEGVTWTEDQIWSKGEKDDPDVFTMEMSTYENPMNTAEVIDRIKAQCLDATEVDIRIYGKRTARGGNVYKRFKDAYPYVIKPFEIPQDKGELLLGLDPHPRTPHAVLWVWVDYEGLFHPLHGKKPNLYCVGELFEPGHIPYLAGRIRAFEGVNFNRSHNHANCDPSAWIGHQGAEETETIYELFLQNGIYPQKGSKDLSGGILKVHEVLDIPEGMEFPRMMIFDTCERLRWEMKNYRWPEQKGRAAQMHGPKQRPVDKDDHLVECQRRLVEVVIDEKLEVYDSFTSVLKQVPMYTSQGRVDVRLVEDDNLGGIKDPVLGV